MSLFSKIGKVIGKVANVAKFIPGPVGTVARVAAGAGAIAGGAKAISVAGKALPALPAIGRALPGIGKVAGRAAGAIGTVATGVAIYDAAGNYLGQRKKGRRINPLNWRALNRALSRVEKAKTAMKRVNSITIRKEKC